MAELAVECAASGLMTPSISRNSSSSSIASGLCSGNTTLVSVVVGKDEKASGGENGLKRQLELGNDAADTSLSYKRRRTVSFSQVWDLSSRHTQGSTDEDVWPISLRPVWVPIREPLPAPSNVETPPITPPASPDDSDSSAALLARATHVLATETAALAALTRLYQTDSAARSAFAGTVEAIVRAVTGTGNTDRSRRKGKLVACAVGKSAFVARKLVAMMTSLGIRSSFMHAAEAVHGDLGGIESGDVVLFVTFSGKTRELLDVVRYLPDQVTVVALTGWAPKTVGDLCPLLLEHNLACQISKAVNQSLNPQEQGFESPRILLPAPIHESEESSFGVCAPTTSTTVAMAVCDMLALTVADRIHEARCPEIFKRNHPGGAIGARMKTAL